MAEDMETKISEFEDDNEFAPSSDHRLVLDVDGFAGPIDVLLTLAREQKVDLTQISILELADQYLAWVAKLQAHQSAPQNHPHPKPTAGQMMG